MNIITDTFIEIGNAHKVCEDYILSTENPKGIIISDGCSSSDNTDMGSRIIGHMAKKHIDPKIHPYWSKVISEASVVSKMLNLNPECLDATLITAHYLPLIETLSVYFYGDGYLIRQDRDGKFDTFQIKYTPEAPYYMSYELNEKRKAAYLSMNVTREVALNGSPVRDDFEYPFLWSTYWYRLDIYLPQYPCVLIASDGLGSFTQKGESVPIQDLLPFFMDYPVKSGAFLKRTMVHQLKKLTTQGIKHYDDLSIGVFLHE